MVTIEEAVSILRRDLLRIPGIVGVSFTDRTIIVYVETPQDAAKVASSYFGFPVVVKVTGPVVTLG
jgi:hypothetical protein